MEFKALLKELRFKASRSSGKGGQNINKVATRVELRFDVIGSQILSEEAKELVLDRLENRISNEGILRIYNQETRSQLSNKERIIKQFRKLIEKALIKPTIRKKIKTPKSVHRKRLENKRQNAEKKANRKKVNLSKIDLFSFFSAK